MATTPPPDQEDQEDLPLLHELHHPEVIDLLEELDTDISFNFTTIHELTAIDSALGVKFEFSETDIIFFINIFYINTSMTYLIHIIFF